jgi:hypothetical protein
VDCGYTTIALLATLSLPTRPSQLAVPSMASTFQPILLDRSFMVPQYTPWMCIQIG